MQEGRIPPECRDGVDDGPPTDNASVTSGSVMEHVMDVNDGPATAMGGVTW